MVESDLWVFIVKYLTVALISAVKFLPGVATAIGMKFSYLEQFLATTLGGIAGVITYTYFGEAIANLWKKLRPAKKTTTSTELQTEGVNSKKERYQKIWNKFGLAGVVMLTPPFFSPPIGVAIALIFKTPKKKLILTMILSFLFWGALLSVLGKYLISLFD